MSFNNGDAVLKGTLILPQKYTKETPVVLMVTGSGLQNRDEEVFEHNPFAVIADALAKQGIATLRYDDRGFGESKGDLVNVTTEDLKNDALAGVELLRKQFKKVGVLGHSEGGTIGLILARRQSGLRCKSGWRSDIIRGNTIGPKPMDTTTGRIFAGRDRLLLHST